MKSLRNLFHFEMAWRTFVVLTVGALFYVSVIIYDHVTHPEYWYWPDIDARINHHVLELEYNDAQCMKKPITDPHCAQLFDEMNAALDTREWIAPEDLDIWILLALVFGPFALIRSIDWILAARKTTKQPES